MKPSMLIFATACLIHGQPSQAANCIGLQALQEAGRIGTFATAIAGDRSERADCGSLLSVLNNIFYHTRSGGRKLEEDKPFDPVKAQANVDLAMRDPALRGRLKQLHSEVQDHDLQLIYEAAILDEEGYYGARDLRITQLQQQLK